MAFSYNHIVYLNITKLAAQNINSMKWQNLGPPIVSDTGLNSRNRELPFILAYNQLTPNQNLSGQEINLPSRINVATFYDRLKQQ